MKIVEIFSRYMAIIFLAFLIHATVMAGNLFIASGLGLCFLFLVKMPSIDSFKFKFGKDKSIEAKDESN